MEGDNSRDTTTLGNERNKVGVEERKKERERRRESERLGKLGGSWRKRRGRQRLVSQVFFPNDQ